MERFIRMSARVPFGNRGFTLSEVLIVVVIIGILSSLAIPRFFGQAEKAKAGEAINMLSSIRRAQLQYYDAHGKFATIDGTGSTKLFSELLGVVVPPSEETHWFYSTQDDGTATATRHARTGETVSANGNLTLRVNGTWEGTDDYEENEKYCPF